MVTGSNGSFALPLASAAAAALVGLAVWLVHWRLLPVRLPATERDDDGSSVLRGVYLFLGLALGVIGALLGASQLLYFTVARLLGVAQPGGVGGDLAQAAAAPASTALVYGAAWAYQRAALRQQAIMYGEGQRQAGVRRLYTQLVALIALAVWASGVAGLLWTLADVVFNAAATLSGDGWRERVALFSTLTLVGLPVWLVHWRPTPSDARDSQSLARRLYVYLSLIAATLALVGSAAAALYRLLGLALGEPFSAQVVTDLAHGLAVAVVAGLVAAYHWRVLRADAHQARRAADSEATPSPTGEAPAPLVVELRAPDTASLARALSALQSSGVEVTVRK